MVIWLSRGYFSQLQVALPTHVLVILGYVGTFVLTTVFPLFVEMFYVAPTFHGYEDFVRSLKCIHFRYHYPYGELRLILFFRNAFFEFLCKKFAQENLQFCEAVEVWKSQKAGSWSADYAEHIVAQVIRA